MATVVSVTLIKQMTYRSNATEEWSNKYYLSGSVPADTTAWKALADALIAQEKTCFLNASKAIRAYGYDSDDVSPSAVWSYDYLAHGAPVLGTAAATGGQQVQGDAASMLEWKTSRLSSKGKTIYLRKYFHTVATASGTVDQVLGTMKTAQEAFGTKLMDGTFLDGRTLRSRLHDETLTERLCSQWLTTRTLKRRGRRPT